MGKIKAIVGGLGVVALIGVIGSIGSVGAYMNWTSPYWRKIGVNPAQMRASIYTFPTKHCSSEIRDTCQSIANGTLQFLGL